MTRPVKNDWTAKRKKNKYFHSGPENSKGAGRREGTNSRRAKAGKNDQRKKNPAALLKRNSRKTNKEKKQMKKKA